MSAKVTVLKFKVRKPKALPKHARAAKVAKSRAFARAVKRHGTSKQIVKFLSE